MAPSILRPVEEGQDVVRLWHQSGIFSQSSQRRLGLISGLYDRSAWCWDPGGLESDRAASVLCVAWVVTLLQERPKE